MEEIGYTLREHIIDGYHFFDMEAYYTALNPKLDKLDISFEDNSGHYHFYDDILRDIIFDLELGL